MARANTHTHTHTTHSVSMHTHTHTAQACTLPKYEKTATHVFREVLAGSFVTGFMFLCIVVNGVEPVRRSASI